MAGRLLRMFNKRRSEFMKTLKMVLAGFVIVSAPLVLTACEQESPLGEAVEEVTDEIDDAT
jgi:hypothetical protein